MPRCDLLVWILVTKLAPSYYTKLDRLLIQTGRYRELCSWRKEFKRDWRKLAKREITMPINDAYRPDAVKWCCTCPAFVTSRFLICKHLVQSVHQPPPVFFLEVKRYRTAPFWRHETLKPILDFESLFSHLVITGKDDEQDVAESDGDDDEDEEELDFDVGEVIERGRTFEEALEANIELITEFVGGLQFQAQFRDQRMLSALEREGAGFLRLARACIAKERKYRSQRGPTPSTWEQSTISALFYHPRPTDAEIDT